MMSWEGTTARSGGEVVGVGETVGDALQNAELVVLALEPAIRSSTILSMEGEDLRQPLGEHLEHALELGHRELGPVVDELLDAPHRLRLALGLVDAVEYLHQAPRMPQLRVLREDADKMHVLVLAELVAAHELEKARSEDGRIEGRTLPPSADALDPSTHLDEAIGEPAQGIAGLGAASAAQIGSPGPLEQPSSGPEFGLHTGTS